MSHTGYSALQIRLHWAIAVFVIIQFSLHDGILRLIELNADNLTPNTAENFVGQSHVWLGLLIFTLAVIRLWVRIKQKAPAAPKQENVLLRRVAQLTHFMLYAIIILMPISGSLAWFGELNIAATMHGYAKGMLIIFVLLHIVGTIYQHAVLKTNVLKRMLKAETNNLISK